MKRILKIFVAFIAVVLLLLLSVPYFFKGGIEELIKKEGNKMLNAEFDFGGLDISLIRNFPLASLTIEDFYLKGVGQFENDTLLSAGEVTAAVNVMSLFGDEGFDIRKILLDNVSVTAVVLPDSTVNWDVMKDSGEEDDTEESSSPFRIKLQELVIDNFGLVYDDRLGNIYARIIGMDAECSGDFGSSRTLLELVASINALTFSMDGVPFINNARIAAGAVVLQAVPENATAVGVPAQIVRVNGEKVHHYADEVDQTSVANPTLQKICMLTQRINELEKKIEELQKEK
jgi:uncharacterized protein involved in outer membrane biogenesis